VIACENEKAHYALRKAEVLTYEPAYFDRQWIWHSEDGESEK